jgi:hypothetical protein
VAVARRDVFLTNAFAAAKPQTCAAYTLVLSYWLLYCCSIIVSCPLSSRLLPQLQHCQRRHAEGIIPHPRITIRLHLRWDIDPAIGTFRGGAASEETLYPASCHRDLDQTHCLGPLIFPSKSNPPHSFRRATAKAQCYEVGFIRAPRRRNQQCNRLSSRPRISEFGDSGALYATVARLIELDKIQVALSNSFTKLLAEGKRHVRT